MADAPRSITAVSDPPGVASPGTWAMYAFAVVGWELVVVLLELLLPRGLGDAAALDVLHPLVTAAGWLVGAWFIASRSAVRTDDGPSDRRGLAVAVVLVASTVVVRWIAVGPPLLRAVDAVAEDHDGLLASAAVAAQGLYYLAEALPVALLVLLGDRFGRSRRPGSTGVPWGGLVAAGTWGAVHLLLQGTSGGLYAMAVAIVLGLVHVLTGRRWRPTALAAAVLMLV